MKILVSERFKKNIETTGLNQRMLNELIQVFKQVDPHKPTNYRNVRQVETNRDIFVLRHRNIRVFFTQQNDNLLLLSLSLIDV